MTENNKMDYRAIANPVYMTAKTAVCLMADAGIPGAEKIAQKLNLNSSDLGMKDPEIMLGNELVVEAKYRTMCRLIEETGFRTNVDLPCGYTPKALRMTEKGMRFVGLDLPIVAQEVSPILLPLAAHPDMIQINGIDATNLESMTDALKTVEGPICISTEGMMMYFTESEASAVVSNVSDLLKIHGGCWITPDPEFIFQFFLTFRSVLGEKAIRKLTATKKNATGQSDVGNLTNSFIMSPADPQGSCKTAMAFLHKFGLKAERLNLADNMPELSSYKKLTSDQITAFKSAMRNCNYWKITLDENGKHKEEVHKSLPFGMNCSLHDSIFAVSLRGRMDTLTTPELLRVWNTEKEKNEITAIRIDCSELQYISSAGLRVLLMMYKSLENKSGFQMVNISDTVREILEVTGFEQFLL